jgi:hypothetical protein
VSCVQACHVSDEFKRWEEVNCHNPNLGFATKARVCKDASQKGISGITSHASGSAKECEGMNPHIPK